MAEETKRPLKVFLCHASGDKGPVRDLYRRLVAEGVDAWLDREKLMPGQDWQLEISRAVREADVVVICLSNQSITKEGYVQKEIRFALDRAEEKPEGTIFLIPARLEDCSVPERLDRWQWVDLFDENGFMKLLSSLKLRADKAGAVIEPLGYEDADLELEHRLDQLYTEGLAAFWVEDWDRAYQRFQTVLREQPNHKAAAEKLAQAERQRNLARLYVQATEAYQSENWLVAIKALEELLEKSGDYKDALPLLKDAKKRRQLRELYAEAKRLHTAQKWQAVVKVFDQIGGIDSAYPDPDGLLPSAQREVVELKRIADLNDLYRQGVHKMDAGEWYEARNMLEQVHKAQTGFLDTERLLRKIEDEILRIEEANKRSAQVQMLYEQAHKMIRAGQWGNALGQMEEIHKLDSQFVDSDGLIEKAKAELEREEQESQQRRELAALYAEAVSLLQAKKYQEALEKWNSIQAIDPKYKDTARVKATARRKLDELSRPETAGRAWPKIIRDVISTEANIPADRELLTEKLLLLSFAIIVLIRLLWGIFPRLFPTLLNWQSNPVFASVYWAPIGGLYGAVLAFALSRVMFNWPWKSSWTLIVGWTLGLGVSFFLSLAQHVPGEVAFIVYRLLTSLSPAVAIKWARPATRPITLILIFLSWILVWMVTNPLGDHLMSLFNADYASAFIDGIIILFGLLFTFGMQVEGSWEVLKTAFFAALGFGFGNYIIDNIFALWPVPEGIGIGITLWGLFGGAILEAPSRNTRRILFTAVVCGIGLLVGFYTGLVVVPAIAGQSYATEFPAQYDVLQRVMRGLGLGLAFGLLIRRASAIGALAVLGAGVYTVTHALFMDPFESPSAWASILPAGLIGLVLGYGYGYMRTVKPLQGEPRVSKPKLDRIGISFLVVAALLLIVMTVAYRESTGPRLFLNPMFEGYRLDWCYSPGTNCGEAAATEWCHRQGYAELVSFKQAIGVGRRGINTKVISSGYICSGNDCDSFQSITCRSP
jgi:outer membrane protein assembly factor BamD (BamD/ComL family)